MFDTSDPGPRTEGLSSNQRKILSQKKYRTPTYQVFRILDDLIHFREPIDEQPPMVQSWNPFTRHKEKKLLKQWVESKKPSAGITTEQLKEIYPKRGFWQNIREGRERGQKYKESLERLQSEISGRQAVPVESLKSPYPTATKYREVTGELKKQGVGFFSRNAIAIQSRPLVWTGKNAAFAPRGEKGLIITPRKVHPTVFKHEAGHAKDYAYYGGEQGFRTAYPHYGNPMASYENRISSTMLPEHRAWAYAKPRSKSDKQLREDALTTYKTVMALSRKLDELLYF